MEQMLRLLHSCGLPVEDVDFINCDGKTMNKLLLEVGCLIPFVLIQMLVLQSRYFSRKITNLLHDYIT
jgi:hypothetical protein